MSIVHPEESRRSCVDLLAPFCPALVISTLSCAQLSVLEQVSMRGPIPTFTDCSVELVVSHTVCEVNLQPKTSSLKGCNKVLHQQPILAEACERRCMRDTSRVTPANKSAPFRQSAAQMPPLAVHQGPPLHKKLLEEPPGNPLNQADVLAREGENHAGVA